MSHRSTAAARAAYPGAVIASALAVLAACASPSVPEPLWPGPGQVLAMVVPAEGVQVYECRAAPDAGAGHAWTFVGPEADLFDRRGRKVGRHGAGPSWTADDGSRIVGTLQRRVDAPDPHSIPWLLLSARSEGGPGAFSGMTSIQRLATVGGVAPAGGCHAGAAGETTRVRYLAEYRFFRPRDVRLQRAFLPAASPRGDASRSEPARHSPEWDPHAKQDPS